MQVIVTTDVEEARKLVAEGYIPVEATYGSETAHSRSAPILTLDHHGDFSDLECPTIRAQKEFFGVGQDYGDYVLSHVDADAFLTVMGLEGYDLPESFVQRAAFVDVHGHHKVPKEERRSPEYIRLTLINDMLNRLKGFGEVEFRKAIQILQLPDDSQTIADRIERLEVRRERILTNCIVEGKFVFLPADEYGLDIAYELGDFVVAYHTKDRYITIGAQDLETVRGYSFPDHGLRAFWPLLGPGWGGRETIGGSPRGERMTMQQAWDAFKLLKKRAERKVV